MSLIVPGGRPVAPSGPVPVDFAFLIGVEDDGNVCVIRAEEADEVKVRREASPDDIYGALSVIDSDRVPGIQVLLDPGTEPYEVAFMVIRMSSGKIMLSPSYRITVNAVREPSREHVFSAASVLHANLLAMKAADMIMASLQGAAQMEQNIAIAKAAGVG